MGVTVRNEYPVLGKHRGMSLCHLGAELLPNLAASVMSDL